MRTSQTSSEGGNVPDHGSVNVPVTAGKRFSPLSDVGAASAPRSFLQGARAVFAGIALVCSDAKLLSLSLVPMWVHASLFVLLVWLGFGHVAGPAIAAFSPVATEGSLWASVLAAVVVVVVVVAVVGVAMIAALFAGSVICDPFYDLLSEQTEIMLVGRCVGEPFSLVLVARGLAAELKITLVRMLLWSGVAVPLWALSFTPAAVVAGPLGLVLTWLFISEEFLSRSLVRHALKPADRFKPLFAHKALCAGFGSMCWLLLFVPFTAPFLVVGATRLYLSLAVHDRAPSLLTPQEKQNLRASAVAADDAK